jgi:predicted transposase/invertase (TIGR01784 family)
MSKKLSELNLSDDFLFSKVMMDSKICKGVLENILDIKIEKVEFLSSQNVIDNLLESKGVRLDIYLGDGSGNVFCCEMQTGSKRELPKRTRYYQGSIDLDLIAKGEKYTKLKRTFIIFICTFDPFNLNRYYYTFKKTCVEENTLLLGDETTDVFLNTKGSVGEVSDELKEFLGYVQNSTGDYVAESKSELVKSIHRKVTEIKISKELEVEYMTLLLRDQEKIEEGREKGREEGRNEILKKLLLSGYDMYSIMEATGLTERELNDL